MPAMEILDATRNVHVGAACYITFKKNVHMYTMYM